MACHTQIPPTLPRPPNFFRRFFLNYTLEIVASYHCMQFQGKRIIQTQENREKPHFRADFGPLRRQNFFSKIWLRQSVDMVCCHQVKNQKN